MKGGVLSNSTRMKVCRTNLGEATLRRDGLLACVQGRVDVIFITNAATPTNNFAGGAQSAAFMHSRTYLNPLRREFGACVTFA
jgi:hypothetical protein